MKGWSMLSWRLVPSCCETWKHRPHDEESRRIHRGHDFFQLSEVKRMQRGADNESHDNKVSEDGPHLASCFSIPEARAESAEPVLPEPPLLIRTSISKVISLVRVWAGFRRTRISSWPSIMQASTTV
jgi:hypothetical protein